MRYTYPAFRQRKHLDFECDSNKSPYYSFGYGQYVDIEDVDARKTIISELTEKDLRVIMQYVTSVCEPVYQAKKTK